MFTNMFGNGQQNPYTLENLQKMQQMQQFNQVNNINIQQVDKFAEIQKTIQNLSSDERTALSQDEEFMMYNQAYEQGLFAFISSQFRQQYNQSADGQKALESLENVLNTRLKDVRYKINAERSQLNEIAELLKNNPEILQQLNKSKEVKDTKTKK